MEALIVEINLSSCYDMIEQYCADILNQLSALQKQRYFLFYTYISLLKVSLYLVETRGQSYLLLEIAQKDSMWVALFMEMFS